MDFFKVFVFLHVIFGSISLVSGLINLISKKSGSKHVLVGRIFTYSMIVTALSSLFLSIIHLNYFLFIVGIFTLYLLITANRYILLRLQSKNQKAKLFDWIISFMMLIAGIIFIVFGTYNLIKTNIFGIVFIVFGSIGLNYVRIDFKNYRGNNQEKKYWILEHLQRITASYIAALTAFLVQNTMYIPFDIPNFLYWLIPTFVLTPFIIKWSREIIIKSKKNP